MANIFVRPAKDQRRVVVTGIEAAGKIAAATISAPSFAAQTIAATGSGTIGAQRQGTPHWSVDDFWHRIQTARRRRLSIRAR